MPRSKPTESVFLNVPFDRAYRPLFEAMVFAVHDCGFRPRCALEASDGGHVRVQKIAAIIRECRLGIHDISRTELDRKSRLPRFNMPFELGVFLGAKWFGDDSQRRKNTLVLDRAKYRSSSFSRTLRVRTSKRTMTSRSRSSRPSATGCATRNQPGPCRRAA